MTESFVNNGAPRIGRFRVRSIAMPRAAVVVISLTAILTDGGLLCLVLGVAVGPPVVDAACKRTARGARSRIARWGVIEPVAGDPNIFAVVGFNVTHIEEIAFAAGGPEQITSETWQAPKDGVIVPNFI